jgi:hypothetical protein
MGPMRVFHLAGAVAAILVPAVLMGLATRRNWSQPTVVRLFVSAAAIWFAGAYIRETGWNPLMLLFLAPPATRMSLMQRWNAIEQSLKAVHAIEIVYWTAACLLLVAAARMRDQRWWSWRIICLLPLSALGFLAGHWIDGVGPVTNFLDLANIVGPRFMSVLTCWEHDTPLGCGAVLFWCIWYAGLFREKSAVAEEKTTAGT